MIPSRRQNPAILSSPRSPSRTMRILSSAKWCCRVRRKMSFTIDYAIGFAIPGFYLIVNPWWLRWPETLRYRINSDVPRGLAGGTAQMLAPPGTRFSTTSPGLRSEATTMRLPTRGLAGGGYDSNARLIPHDIAGPA